MEHNPNVNPQADVDESNRAEWEQNNVKEDSLTTNSTFGSGPSGPIANGGDDGPQQPKERTGKDSNMGGADGGTAGMGYSKEVVEQAKED